METSAELQSTLNQLTIEDFNTPALAPQPYKDGDPISRGNWTSWLIRGFAISRGDPTLQGAYIRWSSAKADLDFKKTFDNYSAAGFDKCLSEAEKQLFWTAFGKVKKHEETIESEYPVTINELAETAHTAQANSEEIEESILKNFPNLNTFDQLSKEEFMQWADRRMYRSRVPTGT